MDQPVTHLLLIRHAESESNAKLSFAGQRDVGLTPAGVAQAQLLAVALAELPIDAVWSSDLQRASLTATAIAAARALTIHTDPALREREMGEYSGLDFRAARERDPAAWERFRSASMDVGAPGGETHRDVARRIVPAVRRIVSAHAGTMVAVVSHGAALQHVLRDLLRVGGDDPLGISFSIGNASVSRFEITDFGTAQRVRVVYLGRTLSTAGESPF